MKIIATHLVQEGFAIKKVYEGVIDGESVYVMKDHPLPDYEDNGYVFVNHESFEEMSAEFKKSCKLK